MSNVHVDASGKTYVLVMEPDTFCQLGSRVYDLFRRPKKVPFCYSSWDLLISNIKADSNVSRQNKELLRSKKKEA